MKKTMLLCFVILLLSNSLIADQSSEIEKLEARIAELEKRVAKLEALLDYSSNDEMNYSDKWKNIAQWRKLKIGMKMDQVRQILGEPTKVYVGYAIIWYYPSVLGGRVKFDTATRKVDGWSEP
ncbi:outer membrane protein assembly factor BamE [bacterium]|nr:MAG: outer membrane protein assembly factor BamE [bacterium]